MPKLKRTYIDDEASDGESHAGSGLESEDDYEKGSFVVSDDEESETDDDKADEGHKSEPKKAAEALKQAIEARDSKRPVKKAKAEAAPAIKVFSNKILDSAKVPPKPVGLGLKKALKSVKGRDYEFRMTFTNGVLLRKFLEPAARAVKKMRFVVCNPEDAEAFRGFRIECHDPAFTLADRGMFECDVDGAEADGKTFCVDAAAFMEALLASTLKETDLRISRYVDCTDRVTFESINNENDVRTVYSCGVVDPTQIDSLDGISIDLGFHVHVQMSTLKELSLNAKRCKAPTLMFDLWQAVDPVNPLVTHSKMCVGFGGENTSGTTDFYISMCKGTGPKGADGKEEAVFWTPMEEPLKIEAMEAMALEKRSSNEYDNKKLRKFLNNMECQFALVHLSTDNTAQPLVLDCVIGGARTKHTLIVAPKETGETAT